MLKYTDVAGSFNARLRKACPHHGSEVKEPKPDYETKKRLEKGCFYLFPASKQ
ncbi:hypothetical protein M3202_19575 [Alkalihalobacillus oceani]|uniref:Uncharacterized protein n=1 Tax=Halalkalibacter oceani TaxID=1653776 RepID=A0A9X2DVE3_9BACI|nr:hypothetical protein [Halalkalibacter oceani]MCM3716247.1 hypothetical protein [Halalkalibacter oceani]